MIKRAVPRVLNDISSWERLERLCQKKVDLCIVLFNRENGPLGYNSSTMISATFLMKGLVHIFAKERLVLTYSFSNI